MPRTSTPPAEHRTHKLSTQAKEQVVVRYLAGESPGAIATSLGVQRQAIRGILKRRGVPLRSNAKGSRVPRVENKEIIPLPEAAIGYTANPVGAPKKTALAKELESSEAEMRTLLRLVAEGVPYTQFALIEPPLAMDVFFRLRGLAVMDRFYDRMKDVERAETLKVPESTIKVMRKNPHYPAILESIERSLAVVARPATVDEWAEGKESSFAREMAGMAFVSESARDRREALNAFLDRRSAKKGRGDGEGGPTINVIVSPEVAKNIEAALSMHQRFALSAPSQEIDATRLNVPRHVEAGPIIDLKPLEGTIK